MVTKIIRARQVQRLRWEVGSGTEIFWRSGGAGRRTRVGGVVIRARGVLVSRTVVRAAPGGMTVVDNIFSIFWALRRVDYSALSPILECDALGARKNLVSLGSHSSICHVSSICRCRVLLLSQALHEHFDLCERSPHLDIDCVACAREDFHHKATS